MRTNAIYGEIKVTLDILEGREEQFRSPELLTRCTDVADNPQFVYCVYQCHSCRMKSSDGLMFEMRLCDKKIHYVLDHNVIFNVICDNVKDAAELYLSFSKEKPNVLLRKKVMAVDYKGHILPETVRGIVYLCEYKYEDHSLTVLKGLAFADAGQAFQAYANIPNPESQMACGATYEDFAVDLRQLHKNMNSAKWLMELGECL